VAGFPSPVTAGTAGTFTVTAKDPYGNTAPRHAGTGHITSTHPPATPPPDAARAHRPRPLPAAPETRRPPAPAAPDAAPAPAAPASITGAQSGIVVNPAAATTLVVAGYPSPTKIGVFHTFTVTARDAYGNTATGYRGTVTLSSSDPQAGFTPKTYTFTTADAG